ncbi:hypothetical protein ACP4OV_020256 [Aristida adscensionis]
MTPRALAGAWKAACSVADNVILSVPAGKAYQIWPVTLAGPCTNGIKLLLLPDDWARGERGQWLHFHGVKDLTVTRDRRRSFAHRSLHPRQFTLFEDCHDISVKGPCRALYHYHLTFTRSSNVEANYLRVTSPEDSVNTNGVHLVDSYNVHVMDNLISTDFIGTLGEHNSNGGGFARKVKFESIVMRNVTNPIIIDQRHSNYLEVADSSQTLVNVKGTVQGCRAIFKREFTLLLHRAKKKYFPDIEFWLSRFS